MSRPITSEQIERIAQAAHQVVEGDWEGAMARLESLETQPCEPTVRERARRYIQSLIWRDMRRRLRTCPGAHTQPSEAIWRQACARLGPGWRLHFEPGHGPELVCLKRSLALQLHEQQGRLSALLMPRSARVHAAHGMLMAQGDGLEQVLDKLERRCPGGLGKDD